MILAQRLMTASEGQADRIIAAMTTQPDATRVAIIRTAVQQIKDAGVWSKLGGLFFFAAHNNQAGRINWMDPSFVAPVVGTVAFTTDRGFTPNGAGGSYVSAASYTSSQTKQTLTSACLGVRVSDSSVVQSNQKDAGQGVFNYLTMSTPTGGLAEAALNSSGMTSTSGVGLADRHVVSVLNGTSISIYAGLSSMANIGTQTVTSPAPLTDGPFFGSNDNTSSSTRRFACGYFGSHMTPTEVAALNNAIHTYMTAIGSP